MIGSSLTPKLSKPGPFCGMDHQKSNFLLISDTLSVRGWTKKWENRTVCSIAFCQLWWEIMTQHKISISFFRQKTFCTIHKSFIFTPKCQLSIAYRQHSIEPLLFVGHYPSIFWQIIYLVCPIPIMGTDYAQHNYIKQNEYYKHGYLFYTIEVP